jgi:hypothetical protein
VRVRAEDTQRVSLQFQTGGIAGKVSAEGAKPEELSGMIMLYPCSADPRQTQLPRDPSTLRLPLRAGTFSMPELPTGLSTCSSCGHGPRGGAPGHLRPVGDTLNLDLVAGKARGIGRCQGRQNGRRGHEPAPEPARAAAAARK